MPVNLGGPRRALHPPLTSQPGVLCFPVLARGGEIVIMRAPDVGQFIANIEGSSLQCFWYGAAPMSVARLEEALSRIAPVMAQLFGQTEAPMRVVAVVQPARSKVGKILQTESRAARVRGGWPDDDGFRTTNPTSASRRRWVCGGPQREVHARASSPSGTRIRPTA